jgi:predicted permease
MLQDLRYGFRTLLKSPAFTIVAALSLGLGIGANTAIFSLVNVALLRPLPVRDADRLASVFLTDQRNPGNLPLSHLNYLDLRDQNQVFTEMAAFTFAQLNYSTGAESEQVPAQVVSGNYFSLLGADPALGRGFNAEEDRSMVPVTVISYGFWDRRMGKDPNVIGKTLTLNRTPFTIVGVAPRGFAGTLLGGGPDVWVPMAMHDIVQPNFDWYDTRRGLFLFAFGRLKPGVTLEQATANLKTVFAQLEQAYPADNRGRSAGAVSLLDARLNPNGQGGPVIVQIAAILMTVVGIVLLIACANIANLLLARASGRRKEIAIRLALGASRTRLVRQLLAESLLLAGLGGGLGILLAFWTTSALSGADLPLPIPVDDTLVIDTRVLAFTAVLALLTGVLFGLAPAIQGSRPDVVPVLKNESVPAGTGHRGLWAILSMRQALVVAQIALSLLSLVAAGLFVRSLRDAQQIDPGFETEGVLVMTFNLGREGYTPERGQLFYQQVAERAATLPGVQGAAVAQNPPLAGGFLRSIFPEGQDTTQQERVLVRVNSVSPGYFAAIGTPLLRGRDFTSSDATGAPSVVVINETMAEQFWPGQDAIGKRFKFFGDQDFTTVIGIARNAKYGGVAEEPIPFIYQPLRQNYTPAAALHVRAAGNAAALATHVRQLVREIDPTLSVFNVRTLEEQVSQSLQPLRFNVILLTTFGGLALLLASIGLYGVANYSVTQRTREIGVRMALGARPSAVLRLVLGHGLVLVAVGLGLGLVLAFVATSFVPPDLLLNVNPRDPMTFIGTSVLLAAVAMLASYLPARRATRIDPLIALRTE